MDFDEIEALKQESTSKISGSDMASAIVEAAKKPADM